MTPKELIKSGNLELFVAGNLNEADTHLVYEAMQSFPDVQKEVERIEQAMIVALEHEDKNPSSAVKENILKELNLANSNILEFVPKKKSFFWQYAAAAMLLLLIGSGFLISNLMKQRSDLHASLFQMKSDDEQLKWQNENLQKSVEKDFSDLKVFRSHDFKRVGLASVSGEHKMVCVYWNNVTHQLYLDNCGLADPGNGKVYQLWAMKDGKPIDVGLFDKNTFNNGLQAMKEVDVAQAFAVTIENAGGASIPTLSTMQVLGKI